MGFHDVQFPTAISYGSTGGPSFDVEVITMDSRHEQRIDRGNQEQRRYDVVEGIRDLDDLVTVRDFFHRRKGPAFGFRYKDWADFTTKPEHPKMHRGAHADDDVIIGTGDGTTTVFQLKKFYTDALVSYTRNIRYPVSGTVLIAVNGVSKTEGVDFTVDHTTGLVTFTVAPPAGHDVTAGCEFDTPARFDLGKNEAFPLSIPAFEAGDAQSLPLVEILSEDDQSDMFFFGGGLDHGVVSSDTSITLQQGRVHRFDGTTAIDVILPDASDLPAGGPYFYVINDTSQTITVVNQATTTILSLTAGNIATVILSDQSGTKTWYGF